MIIVGLHITGKQSSAAIFQNNKIVFAVAEERITRDKNSRSFPINAIQECLNYLGLKCISEIDAICISWNPAINMKNINMSGFTAWRRYDPEWLYIAPNNLLKLLQNDFAQDVSAFSLDPNKKPQILYVEHHLSHAANAIFNSGFEECACLISDEYSENFSFSFIQYKNRQIQVLKQIEFPYSLGAVYSMATEFLGFTPDSDEWKVMGASAYGQPVFFEKLNDIIYWDGTANELHIDLQYMNHYNLKVGTYITKKFEQYIGFPKRDKNGKMEQIHFDFAASVQKLFEVVMFSILDELHDRTQSDHLVVSGGSFMNSLFNGKILSHTPFRNLYIPYAPADNGNAMGSAMWAAHSLYKIDMKKHDNPYLGLEFSNDHIEELLRKYKLTYQKVNNVEQFTAELLTKKLIIGWFQGRMEFGERALGNRSILADPRDKGMQDKINNTIKYREKFRPFAPAILDECVEEYFEIPKDVESPFMEQVYNIIPEKKELIPAVVHHDGTGRVQTVSKHRNERFYKLIEEFYKITDIPIIVNTSFNLNGEPIVYTPEDAIRTFFTSGLDVLVMNEYVISKVQ